MILKIQAGNGWEIFGDVDRVSHRVIPTKEIMGVRDDVVDLTVAQEYAEKERAARDGGAQGFGPRKELLISKGGANLRQIIAYSPIYLMNDNGRTVETI